MDGSMKYGATVLHPVAALFTLCMAGLVLFSGRSRAILAVVLVCVFAPHSQRLVIGGLDFSMLRLIMLVAWARVLVRGEYRGFRPDKLDRIFVLWMASGATIHLLRVGGGGVVSTLGSSFDALTAFFLFRVLVRTREQVFVLSRQLAWIAIVLGVFMAFESAAQYNVFSVLDGASPTPWIRDGRLRCKGPFSHAILAGTFGATLVPIFIATFRGHKNGRRLMASAIFFSTIVVLAASSSGPLIAWAIGLIGWWWIWPLRKQMRAILGASVVMGLFIHLAREKPVWHLIGRLSSVTGGTGYHRYRLIEAFLSHFSEWALLGTSDTGSWGWGLHDVTSEYVYQGVHGGLLTLVLFVLLLGFNLSRLRHTRVLIERVEGPRSVWALLAWGFSVSLAVHCVSLISVTYFGQLKPFFFLFLALIPALTRFRRRVRTVSATPRHPDVEFGQVSADARRGPPAAAMRCAL